MSCKEIADRIYALGFQHRWPPKYPDQLVRSVNALALRANTRRNLSASGRGCSGYVGRSPRGVAAPVRVAIRPADPLRCARGSSAASRMGRTQTPRVLAFRRDGRCCECGSVLRLPLPAKSDPVGTCRSAQQAEPRALQCHTGDCDNDARSRPALACRRRVSPRIIRPGSASIPSSPHSHCEVRATARRCGLRIRLEPSSPVIEIDALIRDPSAWVMRNLSDLLAACEESPIAVRVFVPDVDGPMFGEVASTVGLPADDLKRNIETTRQAVENQWHGRLSKLDKGSTFSIVPYTAVPRAAHRWLPHATPQGAAG